MRRTLIFALLLVVPRMVFGQVSIDAGFVSQPWKEHFIWNLQGRVIDNTFLLTGAYIGLSYDVELYRDLGIQTGLRYAYQEGTNHGLCIFCNDDSYEEDMWNREWRSVHTLSVPFFVTYTVFAVGPVTGAIIAGPRLSLDLTGLTSGRSMEHSGCVEIGYFWSRENLHKKVPCSKWNFAVCGGIEIMLYDKFLIRAGYEYSWINRYTGDAGNSIKTRGFYIGAGWRF